MTPSNRFLTLSATQTATPTTTVPETSCASFETISRLYPGALEEAPPTSRAMTTVTTRRTDWPTPPASLCVCEHCAIVATGIVVVSTTAPCRTSFCVRWPLNRDCSLVPGQLPFRYVEATDDADNPFRKAAIAAQPSSSYKYIPVFVDFDGDGDDDLVLGGGEYDQSLRYAERSLVNGRVTYTEIQASYSGSDKEARWRKHPIHQIEVGKSQPPAHPAFIDFNGDGDLDVVVGSGGVAGDSGKLRFWRYARTFRQGDCTGVKPCFVEETGTSNPFAQNSVDTQAAPIFFPDMNGDKVPELAVGSGTSGVTLFVSNFCQTACTSEGICRNAADQTFRQTCNCLTGEPLVPRLIPATRVAVRCTPPTAIILPAIVSVLPSVPASHVSPTPLLHSSRLLTRGILHAAVWGA